MKQKVYLAGGMTGGWQQKVIESCQGFTFFNPCDHGQGEPALYTAWDLHFVRQCDIVFAYISEDNSEFRQRQPLFIGDNGRGFFLPKSKRLQVVTCL